MLKLEEISNTEPACLPKERSPARVVMTPGLKILGGYPHHLLSTHRTMNRGHGLCSPYSLYTPLLRRNTASQLWV